MQFGEGDFSADRVCGLLPVLHKSAASMKMRCFNHKRDMDDLDVYGWMKRWVCGNVGHGGARCS